MNNLATIEPIALPDTRRPEKMPSLPAWLTSRAAALATNLQPNSSGQFQDVVVLPPDLVLSRQQREALNRQLHSLHSLLLETPDRSAAAEARVLAAISGMLQALPGRVTEGAVEAKGEAYMAALDDVPHWAVSAALRRWYRGECGTDERGRPYQYDFAPGPASLRRIAKVETAPLKARIAEIERLLEAVARVDCTEQLRLGRAAMRGLYKSLGDPAALATLTFARAVELGGDDADTGGGMRPMGAA